MKNNKKLLIQIPNEIIKNKVFMMDSNTFATYTYLKYLYFRNYNNEEIELLHRDFKNTLNISDNRTMKKCLLNLYKQGIILDYIDSFPKRKPIKLTFVPEPFETQSFTQLPATILYKINNIGCIGLRILFYYESFINRNDRSELQFAFPSIETTAMELNINKETVIQYNKILQENKLLKITKYEIEWDGVYNHLDKPLFIKYNNHYDVILKNM
ncbi:hypothetical protein JK635_02045 [Neobacillus sp. YIM B02564]|uniref:Uncharacterized protein n=1 Tax=Neobacillus paridis TaxID=2803862 RepID=A0ABS1TI75_9BACI|nr:hypothetical protein [Neobacillus paridis]MBL4951021.1 hypothetical protein [Neobacillus paridis]